jgi:hypothetical protein
MGFWVALTRDKDKPSGFSGQVAKNQKILLLKNHINCGFFTTTKIIVDTVTVTVLHLSCGRKQTSHPAKDSAGYKKETSRLQSTSREIKGQTA